MNYIVPIWKHERGYCQCHETSIKLLYDPEVARKRFEPAPVKMSMWDKVKAWWSR
jgi:hypothetical protein